MIGKARSAASTRESGTGDRVPLAANHGTGALIAHPLAAVRAVPAQVHSGVTWTRGLG